MSQVLAKDVFFLAANNYLEQLKAGANFEEILVKWRTTSYPYALVADNPHSDEYRAEVLEIYSRLTGGDYDVANEWTSTLQTPEQFERGYPWVSGNFGIIAEEIAKPIAVLRALQDLGKQHIRAIEFGSGWGNLSIPLAKSGVDITLVDIDRGFLDRAVRIADREAVPVRTICGDFLEVAQAEHEKYDVVIFQSAFHHCLEFQELVRAIRDNMLMPGGAILFMNEPISEDLKFAWGLRYDGESLWAIMCNKWLELGFHSDFFADMLLRNGMLPQLTPGVPTLLDQGWMATRGEEGVNFSKLRLSNSFGTTFHDADGASPGRFCRAVSSLPQLGGAGMTGYELEFANYSLHRIWFDAGFGDERTRITLND